MTIEEAIKIINSAMTSYGEDAIDYDKVFEARDMAIEMLKKVNKLQIICDKVKSGNPEEIKDLNFSETFVRLLNMVVNEPSVTSKLLSKGHWIQQPRCEGDEQPDLVCPNCGFKISWWDMGNFCAKCGTGLEGGAG